MLGPCYGEWWKERPSRKHLRTVLVLLPGVLVTLWAGGTHLLGPDRHDRLRDAAERGDAVEIGRLLDQGAAPSAGRGPPLLHLALDGGHAESVVELVLSGSNVNVRDRHGLTPLQRAVGRRFEEIVEILLRYGADANVVHPRYGSALHWASRSGDVRIARVLLDRKAEIDSKDRWRRTPLHLAVARGHRAMAEFLVSRGAAVDAADVYGRAPLHWTAVNGRADLTAMLIALGADVNKFDGRGNSALHHAARRGHYPIASLLLDHSALVDSTMPNLGITPLHLASRFGHPDVVRLLLARGAAINRHSRLYGSPLHWAADSGKLHTARVLISHGADAAAPDDHGYAPVDRARLRQHLDLASFLTGIGPARRGSPHTGMATAPVAADPRGQCELPGRMNLVSRVFLDNFLHDGTSVTEFRRVFSLPDSSYLPLGACLVALFNNTETAVRHVRPARGI